MYFGASPPLDPCPLDRLAVERDTVIRPERMNGTNDFLDFADGRRFSTEQVEVLRSSDNCEATLPLPPPAASRWPGSCLPPVAGRCRNGPFPSGSCPFPASWRSRLSHRSASR